MEEENLLKDRKNRLLLLVWNRRPEGQERRDERERKRRRYGNHETTKNGRRHGKYNKEDEEWKSRRDRWHQGRTHKTYREE